MKIGILGYGNLGRGVECAIRQNPDMELVAVFTRRAPESVSILTKDAKVCSVADVEEWKDKIDVMILCGGSATDLPEQTPKYAQMFNVVDSFDTHAKIPEHFEKVDAAAKKSGHVGIISVGWDPGMFSLNRMYANAILPEGKDYTFWGKGVSQGHSDAIRRVEGVKDGKEKSLGLLIRIETEVLTSKGRVLPTRFFKIPLQSIRSTTNAVKMMAPLFLVFGRINKITASNIHTLPAEPKLVIKHINRSSIGVRIVCMASKICNSISFTSFIFLIKENTL